MDDDDWLYAYFATKAEALAFASGLTWGDEPKWEVVIAENDSVLSQRWCVTFRYSW